MQRRIDQRRAELDQIPENTCSYISTFDLLKDTDWLRLVKIWSDVRPTIIPLLAKNNYSMTKISDALQQLNTDSL